MSRGIFITFEGGEGAGKSTLIERLHAKLVEQGFQVVKTREPGGTLLGEEVRKTLLSKEKGIPIGDIAEMLLFLSARAQHIDEVIKPAIESGKIVLCDRFNDSTVAYQGGGRELGTAKVRSICNLVCGSVSPDVTFFLDIDAKTGLQRALQTDKQTSPKGTVDRIESEKDTFHQKVRQTFLSIAKEEPQRVFCINGQLSKDEVFDNAWNYLVVKVLEQRT